MTLPLSRRQFLSRSAVASTAAAVVPLGALRLNGATPSRFRVGVMGLGRGMAHVQALIRIPGVEVAYVCDPDANRRDRARQEVAKAQARAPKAVGDFRRILEDAEVDGLTIATPNHWHAPATILACAAGKHVYVEKPGSHNARESELIVAAARQGQRHVQMGTQRRSWPGIMEMIQRLRDGIIGRVLYARCDYANARGSIGRGKPVPVPANLDYTLWQGPAPARPYLDNVVHYNWHWRWHWGGGELANNGVHALDLARWGLGVDVPHRVTFNGGRYTYDDDQETPDTASAVYDFDGCGAQWDNSSCHPRRNEPVPFVAFYGEGGTVTNEGAGYRVYDLQGKEVAAGTGPSGDTVHFENWIRTIRGETSLNAEIGDGQKSALLCHLGNIGYRLSRALTVDPTTGKPAWDDAVARLWRREYEPGWEPAGGESSAEKG